MKIWKIVDFHDQTTCKTAEAFINSFAGEWELFQILNPLILVLYKEVKDPKAAATLTKQSASR